jgi:hypothetical protein
MYAWRTLLAAVKCSLALALLALSLPAHAVLQCYNLETNPEMTYTWYVGQPFLPPEFPYHSTVCSAGGAELSYIASRFGGLHVGHGAGTVWSGDDADFIIDNL